MIPYLPVKVPLLFCRSGGNRQTATRCNQGNSCFLGIGEGRSATYRVYQTTTPRIYDSSYRRRDRPGDFVVRTMDDETVFGVESYRKSYVEAVRNGWLSDYRNFALGVNNLEAYEEANRLARERESKGRTKLTTVDFLVGVHEFPGRIAVFPGTI